MATPDTAVDLYLDLLARTLTRSLFEDNDRIAGLQSTWEPLGRLARLGDWLAPMLAKIDIEVVKRRPYNREARELGRDWPARADTMVGLRRLENVRMCIENVIADGVPGDLIETGVWRGGTSIFMRAVLKAYGVTDRKVWLADSFEGLPPPDLERYPMDATWDLSRFGILSVGADEVRRRFARYGLLDGQVEFLVGWFKDTLPVAPVSQLAVLRLDGDLYESTIQALEPLYPKLSPGGYCIVDDYGGIDACRAAVADYRSAHGIDDAIIDIDGSGVYWRKSEGAPTGSAAVEAGVPQQGTIA